MTTSVSSRTYVTETGVVYFNGRRLPVKNIHQNLISQSCKPKPQDINEKPYLRTFKDWLAAVAMGVAFFAVMAFIVNIIS